MVKISFLGDISLHGEYLNLRRGKYNPFESVTDILKESDLVIGNLECTAQGEDGENFLKIPRLQTNMDTLNYLNDIHLKIACLANNHIYDNLLNGFIKTTKFLNENQISFLGAATLEKNAKIPLFREINGIKFCFLNYITKDTNPSLPKNVNIFINWYDPKKAIKDIQNHRRKVDYVIIFMHWGGKFENCYYPDFYQRKIAKILVDNGADLIIGNHSHTLQPFEIYKKKHIFYSLGNFCFSDIYHDHTLYYKLKVKNKNSIILNLKFEKNLYSLQFQPIQNERQFIKLKKRDNGFKIRLIFFWAIKNIPFLWKLTLIKHKYIAPPITFLFNKNYSWRKKIKSFSLKKIKIFLLK